MSSLTPTCDSNQLEALLESRLDAEQERDVMAHLSVCERCRHELESRAAEPASWDEAKSYLTRRNDEPAADDNDIPRVGRTLQIQHVLDALAPTDDPEMLGRLGGCEVSGVVGTGGMGVVLKAFDRSLDRTVAIKVLAPHLASSGAARKRFAREAKAAAAVLHPNVMAIHSVSNDGSLPYLVMPYLRGESLQKRLDHEGPLPLSEILRIGSQIAGGLAAAHAQGLVHRDIKPANILLEDGVERVAITDFGLARAVDDATMTRTGVIAGTPQYMSPEQARGESVDQRSDLFSLGSVLYALCTGRPPFRAETSYGILRRITDTEPRPIREINPDVPEWLCAIVAKLMAKLPDDRFRSASEVAELLESCLAHVQQPTTVPLPSSVEHLSQLLAPRETVHQPDRASGRFPHKPWASARRLMMGAAFAFALLFAGIVIVLETGKGKLTITSEADDVPIRIMQGDDAVENLTVSHSGKTVRIAAGRYQVEIDGNIDGIAVADGTVTLTRGGRATVRIIQSKGAGFSADRAAVQLSDSEKLRTSEVLLRLRMRRELLLQKLGPQHPDVLNMDAQIKATEDLRNRKEAMVDDPLGYESVFDTIRKLGLRKGSEAMDSIDSRYPIRVTGKGGEVTIKLGETKLIQLPKPVMSIEWRAGDFKPEGVDDIEPFDYLLVEFLENGRITFTCYASPPLPNTAENNSTTVDYARIVPLNDFQTGKGRRLVQLDRVIAEGDFNLKGRSPDEFKGGRAFVTVEVEQGITSVLQGTVPFVDPRTNTDGTIRIRAYVENRQHNGKWLLVPGGEVKLTVYAKNARPGESLIPYRFPPELEGQWRIDTVVTGGNARDDYFGQLAEIRGDSLTLRSTTASNTYSLTYVEPNDEHVALDLSARQRSGDEVLRMTFHCLMSITENELRLVRPQRPSSNRPRSLDSPERSETVFILVRDKHDSQRPFAATWKRAESWLREKSEAGQGANQGESQVHPVGH